MLTEEAIVNDEDTFRNARLWDYRPLGDAFDQLQAIRPYYDFTDVDTDRYTIDGAQRQVMLSARELDPSALGGGWVNERINFTHGVGMAMTPVNEVATEGQPRLIVRNLPPVSSEGAPEISAAADLLRRAAERLHRRRRAQDDEFDYPTASVRRVGTSTRWTGDSGIKLDTTLMRVLFALRFRDLNLLISDQVSNESQLLFDRAIAQRLPKIAPFLRYDKDPYIVIDEATGGLVYVQDAYTASDRFPHANWFDPAELESTNLGGGAFNYIRNSVKITIDAYDGTTTSTSPTRAIRSCGRTQGSSRSCSGRWRTCPRAFTTHLRFPEEQFNVQTRMFGRYHVTGPQQFFRERRRMDGARGPDDGADPPVRGLLRRHADARRARGRVPAPPADGPAEPDEHDRVGCGPHGPRRYGDDPGLPFPVRHDRVRPGPDRGADRRGRSISEQLTLWNQAGSTVIRGNLIVIPVGDSVVYLQPFYLQSTGTALPEFQRIVVASPREVVWSRTLGEACASCSRRRQGGGETPPPGPGESPGPTPEPTPPATEPPPGPRAPLRRRRPATSGADRVRQPALRAGAGGAP